jgi:hypothetical protein
VLPGRSAGYAQVRERVLALLTGRYEQADPKTRLVRLPVPAGLADATEQLRQVQRQKTAAFEAGDFDSAAALHARESKGKMVKGGLGADRLPEDDDVDHDAEAVELVFLPDLVVLAELAVGYGILVRSAIKPCHHARPAPRSRHTEHEHYADHREEEAGMSPCRELPRDTAVDCQRRPLGLSPTPVVRRCSTLATA